MTRRWRLVVVLTIGGSLGLAAVGSSQFVPVGDRSRTVLEGNWQSCCEIDGKYAERLYDNNLPLIGPFELHLGPYHEFALFRGVQDDHRDHASAENLLKPFTVEVQANRARHSWDAAGLRLEVAMAGGGREDCESWFLTLKRAGPGSSD